MLYCSIYTLSHKYGRLYNYSTQIYQIYALAYLFILLYQSIYIDKRLQHKRCKGELTERQSEGLQPLAAPSPYAHPKR